MIIINTEEKTNIVFSVLYNSSFLNNGLKKEGITKESSNIYFRIFRTAILGNILYKEGVRKIEEEDEMESEIIALLFESFLFLIRSAYDQLLKSIKKSFKNELPEGFNNFIKNVKNGKYPEIDIKFKEYLLSERFNFEELRNFRNSMKMKTASVFVYVKNKTYHINASVYSDNKSGRLKEVDCELANLVLRYTISLSVLMFYLDKFKK
jgi:hypothetical protein